MLWEVYIIIRFLFFRILYFGFIQLQQVFNGLADLIGIISDGSDDIGGKIGAAACGIDGGAECFFTDIG